MDKPWGVFPDKSGLGSFVRICIYFFPGTNASAFGNWDLGFVYKRWRHTGDIASWLYPNSLH